MTSQSIMPNLANQLFGNMYCAKGSSVNENLKSDKSNQSFDNIFTKSQTKIEYKKSAISKTNNTNKTNESKNSSVNKAKSTANNQEVNKPSSTVSESEQKLEKVNTSKVSETKANNQSDSEDFSVERFEELIANLMNTIEELMNLISETVESSTDEIAGVMVNMEIGYFDLIDFSNFKELSVNILSQGDISNLLTNEEILSKLNDLLNQGEEIITEFAQIFSSDYESLFELEEGELTTKLEEVFSKFQANMFEKEPQTRDKLTDDSNQENSELELLANQIQSNLQADFETESELFDSKNEEANSENQVATIDFDNSSLTMGEFIDNLVNARLSQAQGSESVSNQVDLREVAFQIIEQVKVTVASGKTSMQMTLNPEHLGKVELNIVQKEGIMTAKLITQTQTAKEAIESQLLTLRESLQDQGLKVDAIEVTVSDFHFSENFGAQTNEQQSFNQRGKNRSRNSADSVVIGQNQNDDFENIDDTLMQLNGNTVSFIA